MNDMRQMTTLGRNIEDRSFAVIDAEAGIHAFTPDEWQVVRRIIHSTADFEYKELTRLHPNAISQGVEALRAGCPILVDVKMILAGLNEDRLAAYGCKTHSFISDPDVIATAKAANTTRAIESMRKAHRLGVLDGAIVAVGNAPTALLELKRLIQEEHARPALIIGVPVGFVSAVESKEAVLSGDTPYIVTRGRKGGSPIAVAILHALLLLSANESPPQPFAALEAQPDGFPLPRRATQSTASLTIVGMGDDGCRSLSSLAVNAIQRAQVLVGGVRHLDFFPQFMGEKIAIQGDFAGILEKVVELSQENDVCVLASGDPLFFGIGKKIIEKAGAEHVNVIPYPSSVQWAFARVGLSWDDADFVSLHGRPLDGFVARIKSARKVACFTDKHNSPVRIAERMLAYGEAGWQAWVCENLGGENERVRLFTLAELAAADDVSPLNVLILQRNGEWNPPAVIPYLHEDAFAKRMPKKGLITKREVRALSLAALRLRPDSVVWDIGAGSGSVSIEAAHVCREGRVYAVEVDPEGVAICRENVLTFGVDNVRVVEGLAPGILTELEMPDAVFVGGSKGSMTEIIAVAMERLRPGGALVVNAVTLENTQEAYAAFKRAELAPDVLLLQVSRGVPLARYMRYEALNPIHIMSIQKPMSPSLESQPVNESGEIV